MQRLIVLLLLTLLMPKGTVTSHCNGHCILFSYYINTLLGSHGLEHWSPVSVCTDRTDVCAALIQQLFNDSKALC